MFKKILTLAVLFTATTSMAAQFTCQFTEPFVTVKYDTEKKQMEVVADYFSPIPLIENLDIKMVSFDRFDVVNSSDETLMQIIPDGTGSDGMSDRIFPYSAVLTLPNLNVKDLYLGGPLYGGCETEVNKATGN